MKKNIADTILARKYADGGDVEAPKLDLVQEALDASHAVQSGGELPPHPATTEAALGMATNVLGMEGEVLHPAEAPINMDVVNEVMGTGPKTPMYQPTVERSIATPNADAMATQKLSRDVDFAARRKAQMPVGGKRPKLAEGGEVQTLASAYADGGDVEPTPAPEPEAAIASPQPEPQQQDTGGVNVLNPEGSLVSIPQAHLQDALGSGYSVATPEHVHEYALQQQYGGAGQQIKAGLEGVAQGVAGPLAPMTERAFGVNPEDIRGREEANPVTHGVGEAAGLIGGTVAGVGIGAGVEGAGAAFRAALPAGEAKFVSQLLPEAAKGAFEMALFQGGGEELSKLAKQDPNQTAETALTDIGLATAMGGLFGGVLGAGVQKTKYLGTELPELAQAAPWTEEGAGKFVSQLDTAALEAGDLAKSVEYGTSIPESQKNGLLEGILRRKERADAPAIKAMAEKNGWPVMEGMITDDQAVQRSEDFLRNSPLTRAGARRGAMWNDAWEKGVQAPAEEVIPQSRYTKAEVGDILKQTISAQLEEQNAPISAMYNEIKQYHNVIPLSEKSAPAIARNMAKIQEFRVSPSSPEGQLVSRVMREIGNLKTVDDVKLYKSVLNRSIPPTASSGEKRMASILADKLTDLEESSIERFARTQMKTPEAKAKILDLIEQRKAANAGYKEMIGKVKTLSEQLGKGRVHGVQDALNFIKERLSPEEITQKLNSLKDSEFRKFFAKEYPEGNELLKEYQKGVMHDAAFLGERLNPLKFHKALDKLEPEIQKSLFTPGELQKVVDSRAYMARFPKNFNPSGTAHTLKFGESFSPYATAAMAVASGHPVGAIAALAAKPLGELRDLAMEQFIKGAKNSPEVIKATMLAQATVKGDRLSTKAVNAVFKGSAMPFTAAAVMAARPKLAHMVEFYSQNPDKLLDSGNGNPLPQYAQAFAGTNVRAIQYLASQRPNTETAAPLDAKREPTAVEKHKYNSALDMAQQPLLIMDKIQKGTLTPQDMQTVQTIYPNLYKNLQQKVMGQVMEMKRKGQTLPYAQRLQVSNFLGTPLDSTLTPQGILNLQMVQSSPQKSQSDNQQGTSGGGVKPAQSGAGKLQGLSKAAMTPGQARTAERSAGK